jgi:hypothetical protein
MLVANEIKKISVTGGGRVHIEKGGYVPNSEGTTAHPPKASGVSAKPSSSTSARPITGNSNNGQQDTGPQRR